MNMRTITTKINCICLGVSLLFVSNAQQITPYKFDNENIPKYIIPSSARYTVPRFSHEPDIVYYFSKPESSSYPIVFFCTGSTSKGNIYSVIHVHRHVLQECMDLNIGLVTVEQWGIDGNAINEQEFISHYTRSQRLHDHITVIEHLKLYPPQGWNGKIIFIGVSEGGPLVITLTEQYTNIALATMNWCGAGDWNWRKELWAFIQDFRKNGPWWFKIYDKISRFLPGIPDIPQDEYKYDARMDEMEKVPCIEKSFMGMTYKYHVDAMQYPDVHYENLYTPFLVVAGARDSIIDSCDLFVQKAKNAGVPITYLRVTDMDHYIRRRPDVIKQCFIWLKKQIGSSSY